MGKSLTACTIFILLHGDVFQSSVATHCVWLNNTASLSQVQCTVKPLVSIWSMIATCAIAGKHSTDRKVDWKPAYLSSLSHIDLKGC